MSVLLCFALVPSGAQAETEIDVESLADVTFTNYLEWSIYYLFISPSDSEYYGGDVIDTTGATIMAPYDSLLLYMVPGDYDILILDEDYDIWTGAYSLVDGSEIYFDELSLTYEGPSDAGGLINIDVYVDTTASVDYLFLSPNDSESWGVDLLGMGSLDNGDVLTITLIEYEETVDYDLLAIFDDGDQVTVAVEAYDGAEFYLVDTVPGDDDVSDDDDVVPDDDDVIPDDDDIVTDDDDELPPEQQPGGVSGNKDEIEGEENKDSSALGIIAIITTMTLFIAIRMYRRKN
ncbi:MAG: hypothetical protein ACMUFK_00390 [Thermoplasmatota archaeon]